jgi:hypothetical protein
MKHTYKIAPSPPGQKGIFISRYPDVEGIEKHIGEPFLHLPAATIPEAQSDTVMALQRAYRDGREDRSEELLGDAQQHPSHYHRVPIPDHLRATWGSSAAAYWRDGVDACLAH